MSARPTLRALSRTEFTIAHVSLATALVADVLAVVVGVLGAVNSEWAGWATVILALLALLAVWTRGLSDHYAAMANDILRRLDLLDGLGWEIDPLTRMDLIDDAPAVVQRWATRAEDEPYFGSVEEPSPGRLIENLRESAWWTKRLAGDMATGAGWFMAALMAVGVVTLIVAINGLISPDAVSRSATWLSALILFLISQAPHQARRRYTDLKDGAERVQKAADSVLRSGGATEVQAVNLAAEYHLVRQCAPVIPTAWYNRRRDELNRLWKTTVQPAG